MARSFPVGFRIHIPEPVEVKMVSQSKADRDAIDFYERFKGLFTYVVEDDTFYYLSGGITNTHWKPLAGNQIQAVEILDVFSDEKKTVISGYAIKKYLEENYVTKSEFQQAIQGIQQEIPDHLKNITPQQIAKWDSLKGDFSELHIEQTPKRVWLIKHPIDKSPSINTYLPDGRKITGRETIIDPTTTAVSFSVAISGYATLN